MYATNNEFRNNNNISTWYLYFIHNNELIIYRDNNVKENIKYFFGININEMLSKIEFIEESNVS